MSEESFDQNRQEELSPDLEADHVQTEIHNKLEDAKKQVESGEEENPDAEILQVEEQAKGKLQALKKTQEVTDAPEQITAELRNTLQQINHDIPIPYDKIQADKPPKHSFDDIKQAIDSKDFGKLIEITFTMFFSNDNEIEGMGYFQEGIAEFSDDQAHGILQQLSETTHEGEWDSKDGEMKASVLRSSVGWELHQRGWRKEGMGESDGSPRVVSPGQTLKDVCESRSAGLWEKVQEQKGKILGPLFEDKSLPQGGFVHFDSETGLPIVITQSPDNAPRIHLYRKDPEASPDDSKDAKIEYFISTLEEGDMLLPNEPKEGRALRKKGMVGMARALQGEPFHAMHFAVYIGDGYLQHLVGTGVEKIAIKDILKKRYNAFSVARIHAPAETRKKFAEEVVDVSKNYDQGYSEDKLKKRGIGLAGEKLGGMFGGLLGMVGGKEDDVEEGKGICMDLCEDAAANLSEAEIEGGETVQKIFGKIAEKKTVIDIIQMNEVEIVESMEFM